MPSKPIASLFESGKPLKSVEFFPPKTPEDRDRLFLSAGRLYDFEPDFVSVTYGAGGTTRDFTKYITSRLQKELGWDMMPHLTCVGSTRDELGEIIDGYYEEGFRNIMTLRGDPPKGATEFVAAKDGFRYASDLAQFIKQRHPDFCLGVAGYPEKHPEAPSMEIDLKHLKHKVACGGDFITTQLFFDNSHYFTYLDAVRAQGITVPVVPGILPILSLKQIKRFGVALPAELERRMENAGGDREVQRRVGAQWAAEQIIELIQRGAPGFHLYVMNRSTSALEILETVREAGIDI